MLAGRPQRHEGRRGRSNQLASAASYRIPGIDLYVEALAWMWLVGIDEDRGNMSPLTLTSYVTRGTARLYCLSMAAPATGAHCEACQARLKSDEKGQEDGEGTSDHWRDNRQSVGIGQAE